MSNDMVKITAIEYIRLKSLNSKLVEALEEIVRALSFNNDEDIVLNDITRIAKKALKLAKES